MKPAAESSHFLPLPRWVPAVFARLVMVTLVLPGFLLLAALPVPAQSYLSQAPLPAPPEKAEPADPDRKQPDRPAPGSEIPVNPGRVKSDGPTPDDQILPDRPAPGSEIAIGADTIKPDRPAPGSEIAVGADAIQPDRPAPGSEIAVGADAIQPDRPAPGSKIAAGAGPIQPDRPAPGSEIADSWGSVKPDRPAAVSEFADDAWSVKPDRPAAVSVFADDAGSVKPEGPDPEFSRPVFPPENIVKSPHPPVETLFEEVRRGNAKSVYQQLKERFKTEMLVATQDHDRDATAFHRTYLINLLKAGEEAASFSEQEATARAFVEHYPNDKRFPEAYFLLNQALFQQGKPLEESFLFDGEALASLTRKMQAGYLVMLSKDKALAGEFGEAARLLLDALKSRVFTGREHQARIEEYLGKLADINTLRKILSDHREVGWLSQRAPFLLARVFLNLGIVAGAAEEVRKIETGDLVENQSDKERLAGLNEEIESRKSIRPQRIGVLLPLGSSSRLLRSLAVQTFEGLRMAVQFPEGKNSEGSILSPIPEYGSDERGDFSGREKRKNPIYFELIVRDSGNNAAQARRLVEELVREERVVAIIGPIARAESEAAAEKAEELGVPLISLSLSMELPREASFVFRHSKSQDEEIRDLVRYAMGYLHARRFAILYPRSGFGRSVMQRFWKEVGKQGGKIVAVSSYRRPKRLSRGRSDQVEFNEIFAKFTGKDRPVDQADLELAEKLNDSLPDPIVDFDAIFIPVGPTGLQDLQLIAPYPVTVDAENVKLLGNRFWNQNGLVIAGNGKLNGAVFIDSFDRNGVNPMLVTFRGRHRTIFGHRRNYRPPTHYTGLGYDSARMLIKLLSDPRHRSRKRLAQGLKNMEPFFGVTGWTRFKGTGESVKESMFFQLRSGRVVRINP